MGCYLTALLSAPRSGGDRRAGHGRWAR